MRCGGKSATLHKSTTRKHPGNAYEPQRTFAEVVEVPVDDGIHWRVGGSEQREEGVLIEGTGWLEHQRHCKIVDAVPNLYHVDLVASGVNHRR